MCAVCGLPTNHSTFVQSLGWITVTLFTLTTFVAAWTIVTSHKVRLMCKKLIVKARSFYGKEKGGR